MPHGGNASAIERSMEHGGEVAVASTAVDGGGTRPSSRWADVVGRNGGTVLVVGAVIVLPLLLDNFWMGLVAEGIAFAVIFLSYTLVTGEGGMIWLCQVTFAVSARSPPRSSPPSTDGRCSPRWSPAGSSPR